jgi:RND superfamily putative drug exporter
MTTLLPALLVLAGRRLFWPRIPRHDGQGPDESGAWVGVAALVGRRPRAVALSTGGLLLLLCLAAPGLDASGVPASEAVTGNAESVVGQLVLGDHFPAGSGTPVTVIGAADRQDQLLEVVRAAPGVQAAEVFSRTPGSAPQVLDGQVLVQAVLGVAADSSEAAGIVRELRSSVDSADPGALVGGFTAVDLDLQTASQRDNRVIIPLVLVVILLVLGLLLRAVVAPLLLVATVVVSFVATLGACALVFQNVFGYAGSDSSFPLFAFVFLVALGIDYNIFLMTRVREETVVSGTREGTLRGLAVTGGVITSAGVVLAATFAVLGVLPLVFLAQLGFAVAFGVLLDTIIVRSLLVPALTLELDRRVWWPSRLSRIAAPDPGVTTPSEPVSP